MGSLCLSQLVQEWRNVPTVNVMLYEGFLFQSRHTVGYLVLKRCNFHLEEDPDGNLLAPLERFQQSVSLFRISLISYGRVRDLAIITRLLELVQSRCF